MRTVLIVAVLLLIPCCASPGQWKPDVQPKVEKAVNCLEPEIRVAVEVLIPALLEQIATKNPNWAEVALKLLKQAGPAAECVWGVLLDPRPSAPMYFMVKDPALNVSREEQRLRVKALQASVY